MTRTEYFVNGTVPKESCDCHVTLKFCKVTNKLARERCPKHKLYTKIYRKRPAGSTGTTADSKYALNFNPADEKNKCPKHTDAWYEKRQKILEKRKKQQKAATATQPGTPPTVPTPPAPNKNHWNNLSPMIFLNYKKITIMSIIKIRFGKEK